MIEPDRRPRVTRAGHERRASRRRGDETPDTRCATRRSAQATGADSQRAGRSAFATTGASAVLRPRRNHEGGRMTPHQRRMRELEASRRLQSELQDLIDSHPGTVPCVAVAEAFERCGSLLPQESDLLRQIERLSQGLRNRSAAHIGEDALRRVISTLRQRSDTIGSGITQMRVAGARDSPPAGGRPTPATDVGSLRLTRAVTRSRSRCGCWPGSGR